LPGKPHQTGIGQFPGGAIEGFVGHAQEVRQLFARDRESNGPGILHIGQEQEITGDPRLGRRESQVDQASPQMNDHQGQHPHPLDGKSFIASNQV